MVLASKLICLTSITSKRIIKKAAVKLLRLTFACKISFGFMFFQLLGKRGIRHDAPLNAGSILARATC